MARPWILSFWLIPLSVAGLFHARPTQAADLLVLDQPVPVYSGPGVRFRRVLLAPPGTRLKAAVQTTKRGREEFFVVEITDSNGNKRAGYVSTLAAVKQVQSDVTDEDIEKFGSIALIDQAIQVAYSSLQDGRSLQTIAYLTYLSPGFYTKIFAGQFMGNPGNGLALGAEIGNDALLVGRISGVVSVGLGGFWPNQVGAVFTASSQTNAIAVASFGLRYNAFGMASLSVVGTQTALLNQNNSLVVGGVGLTLEVGL